jgi:hypothetical protein
MYFLYPTLRVSGAYSILGSPAMATGKDDFEKMIAALHK